MGQRQKGCSFLQAGLQSGAPQEAGGHMWEGHPSSPGTPPYRVAFPELPEQLKKGMMHLLGKVEEPVHCRPHYPHFSETTRPKGGDWLVIDAGRTD